MKISFTGDLIFSGKFTGHETDADCIDDNILNFLSESDSCVCNIEGPVFSGISREDKIAHRNSTNITDFTSRISGNVWYIGNDHIMDYDYDGLDDNSYNELLPASLKNISVKQSLRT